MILPVTDNNISSGHNSDAFKTLELSISTTPGPEGSEERAIWMEDLDPVVTGVSNHDVALVIYRYAPVGEIDDFISAFTVIAHQSVDFTTITTITNPFKMSLVD